MSSLASSYYISHNSTEATKIDTSVNSILKNLNTELGYRIKRQFVFGSYDRDTILPRRYDSHSDVDIMIVFNHTDYERTPETYRTWLKNFADKYYAEKYGSKVVKSFPTVTVELQSIKFDLVPAKEEVTYWSSKIYIPDGGSSWQITNPHDVKENLSAQNKRHNFIVKPIIRLFKAWNAKNDYPFESFDLETKITNVNYLGETIQSGFFYAADHLSTNYLYSISKNNAINNLKKYCGYVKMYLNNDDLITAKYWLHQILPE